MSPRRPGPPRALVCAPLPPEFDRESGSRRIYHMVQFLLEAGWRVSFVCENAPAGSRHVRHLRQRGVDTRVGFGGATADMVEAGDFDVAIFAFWYLAFRQAELVRRLSPRTRIVVESVDLHWLRGARRILGGRDGSTRLLDEEYAKDLVGEINTYARADAVLTVSSKEARLVNDMLGVPRASAVPDCDDTPPGELGFAERRGILFVGNFRHPPNLDAVRYLCEEILPLLPARVRREHPLQVVGNGLDGRVRAAVDGCGDVRLVGWVPSLVPYLHAARVSVVPLRYGAGTKRKLIQSLLAHTPCVTTPVGVEGMDVQDGEHVLVGEDAVDVAAALERLLADEATWKRLASRGRSRMLRSHGRAETRARLLSVLERVVERPAQGVAPPPRAGVSPEVESVRRAVDASIPEDAAVLVVSRGDPDLIRLPGRRARHFPLAPDGGYAGHHPRDSQAAIRHLDELRADYLLVPAPSFWWLDHYDGFARHLADRHQPVWSDEGCVIYRLCPVGPPLVGDRVPFLAGTVVAPAMSNGSPARPELVVPDDDAAGPAGGALGEATP